MNLFSKIPSLKPGIFLLFGLLGICLVSFASTSTTTTTTSTIVNSDGSIVIKTVYSTVSTHNVDEIKDSLVATSTLNEKTLFDLIQSYRKQEKKSVTLKYSNKLANVSRTYAKSMSDKNLFSHTDPQGRNGGDRLTAAGFEVSYWGEALGEGKDASQVFAEFKKSKLHNAILLDDTYNIIGIGYYKGKWVVSLYKDKKLQYADKGNSFSGAVVAPAKIMKKGKSTTTVTSNTAISGSIVKPK